MAVGDTCTHCSSSSVRLCYIYARCVLITCTLFISGKYYSGTTHTIELYTCGDSTHVAMSDSDSERLNQAFEDGIDWNRVEDAKREKERCDPDSCRSNIYVAQTVAGGAYTIVVLDSDMNLVKEIHGHVSDQLIQLRVESSEVVTLVEGVSHASEYASELDVVCDTKKMVNAMSSLVVRGTIEHWKKFDDYYTAHDVKVRIHHHCNRTHSKSYTDECRRRCSKPPTYDSD